MNHKIVRFSGINLERKAAGARGTEEAEGSCCCCCWASRRGRERTGGSVTGGCVARGPSDEMSIENSSYSSADLTSSFLIVYFKRYKRDFALETTKILIRVLTR